MTASVTHHQGQAHASLAHQAFQQTMFALQLVARGVKRAGAAVGNALMRWAVAYESVAQERIMRELALSHPTLVAQIRDAREVAASESARRASVTGMWE